jgi:putative colanic acid biosynthesis acetyltransferase WcaF
MKTALHTHRQADAYASPWSPRRRLAQLAWEWVWLLACVWTPKPFNRWRLLVLRLFGAEIHGTPFVHQRARIQQPRNLVLHHRACLGDRTAIYSLDRIEIRQGATIAQEAYLCAGTHDFGQPHMPLQTAPIVVGAGAFVGARAFVLPGVSLGERCIVGAMAMVARDVPAGARVGGNPARILGQAAIVAATPGNSPMPASGDTGQGGA